MEGIDSKEIKNRDARTVQMIGEEGMARLRAARVLVVGVGGVGSYAAEAIARAGVGTVTVCDGDEVAASNLNRQLVALASTIGSNKAIVMAERIKDINPACQVTAIPQFYGPARQKEGSASAEATAFPSGSACAFPVAEPVLTDYDWIIDAIDDVDAKIDLICSAKAAGVNIVSAMGAAGKFETSFKVADISKTSVCPLAKVVRKRLRDAGVEHLPVVFSEEKPLPRNGELGSISYVPGSMGLELAGYVIKEIVK